MKEIFKGTYALVDVDITDGQLQLIIHPPVGIGYYNTLWEDVTITIYEGGIIRVEGNHVDQYRYNINGFGVSEKIEDRADEDIETGFYLYKWWSFKRVKDGIVKLKNPTRTPKVRTSNNFLIRGELK